MAKLRHISLHTADPNKTAQFYKRVFDMVEVGRTDSKFAEGIFLSDGTVNLSVVRFKTEQAADRGDGLGNGHPVCSTVRLHRTRAREKVVALPGKPYRCRRRQRNEPVH